MRGICFKELLFHKVVNGTKTQTRRIIKINPIFHAEDISAFTPDFILIRFRSRYQPGERLFLKEPWCTSTKGWIYKFDGIEIPQWRNKLFMPERAARHFIQITDVTVQRLQEITEHDAIAEGFKDISSFQEPICEPASVCSSPMETDRSGNSNSSKRNDRLNLIAKNNGGKCRYF